MADSNISRHYYLCGCPGRRYHTLCGLVEVVPENENQPTKLVLLNYLRARRAAGEAGVVLAACGCVCMGGRGGERGGLRTQNNCKSTYQKVT